MKRRGMKGIPSIVPAISFGDVDPNPFAPLHRRLGIQTYTHRLAVLNDPKQGEATGMSVNFSYDAVNRVWSNDHLYRASITLPKVFV